MARLQPDPKPTGLKRFGLPVTIAAWLCLIAVGGYFLLSFGGPHGVIIGSGKAHEQVASIAAGSTGSEREAALMAATKRYIEAHPDAPAAMRNGKELAPADFLNKELAAHNRKFRVRKVIGANAELYDVS